ncbi:MAG TPA: hypothetical protein PLG86_01805 [Bacteroidales bacterium]|nr:hypothetical protein [Bacteroidales bacterium]
MKNTFKILKLSTLILFFFFIAGNGKAKACEIKFQIVKNEKTTYNVGDELVVRVVVEKTHRRCETGIDATEFSGDGLKVTAATPWKETGNGFFTRELKVKVTGNKNGKLVLYAKRTCSKQGGMGKLELKGAPPKKK